MGCAESLPGRAEVEAPTDLAGGIVSMGAAGKALSARAGTWLWIHAVDGHRSIFAFSGQEPAEGCSSVPCFGFRRIANSGEPHSGQWPAQPGRPLGRVTSRASAIGTFSPQTHQPWGAGA